MLFWFPRLKAAGTVFKVGTIFFPANLTNPLLKFRTNNDFFLSEIQNPTILHSTIEAMRALLSLTAKSSLIHSFAHNTLPILLAIIIID